MRRRIHTSGMGLEREREREREKLEWNEGMEEG